MMGMMMIGDMPMIMSMPNTDALAAANFNERSHARTDVNFDMTALVRYRPDEIGSYDVGYSRKSRSPNLYERYSWTPGSMSSMINWFGDGNATWAIRI